MARRSSRACPEANVRAGAGTVFEQEQNTLSGIEVVIAFETGLPVLSLRQYGVFAF